MTDRVTELFERLAIGDREARDELVAEFNGLAKYLASRFRGRGEPTEDLEQVAALGLLKAIDRFELGRSVRFSSFAAVTITGELKRHLRDKAWALRVPRGLKQDGLRLGRLEQELTQRLGHPPTVAELAAEADLSEDEVIEALDARGAYAIASLDAPIDDERGTTVGEAIGSTDSMLELADRLAVAREAIQTLSERERLILYLRFYEDLTQTEIGVRVGISQMHVSRLLTRALDTIRAFVQER